EGRVTSRHFDTANFQRARSTFKFHGHRLAVRQGFGEGHKFTDPLPEQAEIFVHVAGKTIGNLARHVRILVSQYPETELGIVESIDKLTHILNALSKQPAVFGKA